MSRHYRISLADAISTHDEALRYGGRPGVLSVDGIQSAIFRPYSGYHRFIHRKSAALLEAVIQNHAFVDGNKRCAWILAETLIERSGYVFEPTQGEMIDDTVVAVATGEVSFNDLVDWFSMRTTKKSSNL